VTVFNILGPSRPPGANAQVIGVYSRTLVEPLARVLTEFGTLRAFVVHGADGLDEISTTGESWTAELREGLVRTSAVRPGDFGVPRAQIADLRGGDREENAEIIRRILAGDPGPRRDMVVVNTGAALVACARARDFKEGAQVAAHAIDSGAARERLDALVHVPRELAGDKA
jgi:anthranilate phosphoribosyltransferase